MNKKYEEPQLDIQYFNVTDRLTSDMEHNFSNIDDQWDWEEGV